MTKRTLDVGSIANDLENSKYFEHRKEQKTAEEKRTGEQVNSYTPVQVNSDTGEQAKDLISEKTTRKPFNIFKEHDAQIDWYVNQKKRSGKTSYSRSEFMRELLDKFFKREKRLGNMKNYAEQVSG